MKKRILSLLVAAVLVVGLLPMAAFAADAPTATFIVTADKESVDMGGTVTYTVSVKSSAKLNAIGLTLVIPEGMTYVSGKLADGATKENLGLANNDYLDWTDSTKTLVVAGTSDLQKLAAGFDLVTFTCTAAAHGAKVVTLTDKSNVGLNDENFTSLEVSDGQVAVTPATVTVNKTAYSPKSLEVTYETATLHIEDKDSKPKTSAAVATGMDSDNTELPPTVTGKVTYAFDGTAPAGLAIDSKTGVVSVTDAAAVTATKATVKATLAKDSVVLTAATATAEITINKAEAVAKSVKISGPATAVIPAEGKADNVCTYTATVLDQYGAEMTTAEVEWTAEVGTTTATFADGENGAKTLTVSPTAVEGEVNITATVKGTTVKAEKTVQVTTIGFEFDGDAKDAVTVKKDPVYGDTWGDIITINAGKITAKAEAKVEGTYTVGTAEKADASKDLPDAGEAVAYKVYFTSKDGVYENVEVAELAGTVKVTPKTVTVTANDVTIRLNEDVPALPAAGAAVEGVNGNYTATEMVGEDKLNVTAMTLKYFNMDEDGKPTTAATLIDTSEPNEYVIVINGATASANYTVEHKNGILEVRKKSSMAAVGTGTKPEQPDDQKPGDTTTIDFVDVADEDWFAGAVDFVVGKGLFKGISETEFAPNNNMTRAMVATVLYRLDGEHQGDVAAAFEDVVADTWYTDGVAWAAEKGVVKGLSETVFAPDDNVTREQLATMLYRYVGEPEVDAAADMAGFEDVTSVSDWAAMAMRWAVENGIIKGKDGARLDPQGNATRAEVATMLQRFVDLKK